MAALRLHPDNPHYLEFRGRPTLLMTSGEHYGAVLNLDMAHAPYLDALARHGLNLTRTFSGSYREVPGSFSIAENNLAPRPERFIAPWARSDVPGDPLGGNKFDLGRWDEAYFRRLRAFVGEASRRGIVVELVMFCFLYNDALWQASPLNAASNINGVGDVPREAVYTLAHPALLAAQERLARKLVAELAGFDNVYFEIINEPYCYFNGDAFLEWQWHMARVIGEAQAGLAERHLIAQNYYNRTLRIPEVSPEVSILNFHYAEPSAAMLNYHWERPLADDETGFKGQAHEPYRAEAWEFMLAGGGIFSHLDYSFTTAHPDGTATVDPATPGLGGAAWRAELAALKRFLEGFDFLRMAPHDEALSLGHTPDVPSTYRPLPARLLAEVGRAYAAYLAPETRVPSVRLALPAGRYRAEWLDPATGNGLGEALLTHAGGWSAALDVPEHASDVALRVRRAE